MSGKSQYAVRLFVAILTRIPGWNKGETRGRHDAHRRSLLEKPTKSSYAVQVASIDSASHATGPRVLWRAEGRPLAS